MISNDPFIRTDIRKAAVYAIYRSRILYLLPFAHPVRAHTTNSSGSCLWKGTNLSAFVRYLLMALRHNGRLSAHGTTSAITANGSLRRNTPASFLPESMAKRFRIPSDGMTYSVVTEAFPDCPFNGSIYHPTYVVNITNCHSFDG